MRPKTPITQPKNVRELADLWPSRRDFAHECKVTEHMATSWIKRGRIPAEHHFDVVTAARLRGLKVVTAELIDSLHTSVKRRKAKKREVEAILREAQKTAAE